VKAICPPVIFHHEKGIPVIEYSFIVKTGRKIKYAEKTGNFREKYTLFGGRNRDRKGKCVRRQSGPRNPAGISSAFRYPEYLQNDGHSKTAFLYNLYWRQSRNEAEC
jgi:hypothetical protein